MLSFDYTAIRKEDPERQHVWDALQIWTKAHPELKVVPVLDLMLDLRGTVEPPELLEAIDTLVSFGQARKVYRVIDPGMKVLLPKSYGSRREVPDKVQDNWDKWIDVKPQDVAMVLEGTK